MRELKGIPASTGVAIAKAYSFVEPILSYDQNHIQEPEIEVNRLKNSIASTKEQLQLIYAATRQHLGEEKATIFSAQQLVLEDPVWIAAIIEQINEGKNAETALTEITDMYRAMFLALDNDYMKDRVIDIQDVSKRLLADLLGVKLPDLSLIDSEIIIVAEDLTPSVTVQLNKQYVKGTITNIGGTTSHSAILARSLGIPAIVGTKTGTLDIEDGTLLIIDGEEGRIIIDPPEDVKMFYLTKQKVLEEREELLRNYLSMSSVTMDGHQVHLVANIGAPEDGKTVLSEGGEGIGLFRTEFMYMNRNRLPDEEEQFEAYQAVISKMEYRPTVIRTMDIGGDKALPYLELPNEMNPFLGYRAIRISLDRQTIFRTQLRALLRASKFGKLKIMFPMISTLEEFRTAKSILFEEKEKLLNAGVIVSEEIEVGMMVETPAAVMIVDLFAQEADFFSIGTNDLIQYMFAADRLNEQVSYLYQPYHPAILRAVQKVVEAAHLNGKSVGVCGEMAGEQIAIPLLLALGVDELSMDPSAILKARSQIAKLNHEELRKHMKHILTLATDKDVTEYVKLHLL